MERRLEMLRQLGAHLELGEHISDVRHIKLGKRIVAANADYDFHIPRWLNGQIVEVGYALAGVEGLQQIGHTVRHAAGRGRYLEKEIVFDLHR